MYFTRTWSERLTRPFSRVTSSGAFLPQIDGLRFVAILAVYLFHLGIYVKGKCGVRPGQPGGAVEWILGHLTDKGDLGVQLFFVISGFILALPFAAHFLEGKPPVRLKHYYLRRLTRLEPPYLINLAILFPLLVIVAHQSAHQLLPNLFASVGYISYVTMGHPSVINDVAWSLEVEVQFYLLAPWLCGVFRLRKAGVRWAAMGLLTVLGLFLQHGLGFTEKTLLGNLQFFLTGLMLCEIYLTCWQRHPTAVWHWDGIALLAWLGLGAAHRLAAAWLFPPLILVAYMGAFRGVLLRKVFTSPWPVTIGGMCYTIYLYHYCFISLVGRFTASHGPTGSFPAALLAQFILITPAVFAGCAGLFLLFERPFMQRDWPVRLATFCRALVMGPKKLESASLAPALAPALLNKEL